MQASRDNVSPAGRASSMHLLACSACGLWTRAVIDWTVIMSLASKGFETNGTDQNNAVHVQAQCPALPSPRLGTHIISTGNGRSVGTAISLQCPSKHRPVGGELKCVMDANSPRWVGELSCKPLSPYKDSGFRVAVLASIISIGIICIMSLAFITCCIWDCAQQNRAANGKKTKQRRDSFKSHLEDGGSYHSLEGRCDVNLGEHFSPWGTEIPENLIDNSSPQWLTHGLVHTQSPSHLRPFGFYDNRHPLPPKSNCAQVFGRPHDITISSCSKCPHACLLQIPTEQTDLVRQPYGQR
ncbi:uncharacterized protein LOC119135713 isoform X1 [Syngnathus acus]|uniref:uncharacterized protein LOC119135713 isoform X1 n=1 Tax=Syngnathus acus TaxID=161584 RepID=UPI001885F055|nr:uncharacterized protein LOC119135713 isoform X1 [Syngnathus acus]